MSAHNVAVVRRWFEEVWNHRKDETIDELIGPDSVCYMDTGELRGPAAFREQQYVPFITAFPDIRVKVEDVVAERDVAVVRWSAEGTHTGDGLGTPPTGRKAQFEGISWIHVRDGKMAKGHQWSNIPTVLNSLKG